MVMPRLFPSTALALLLLAGGCATLVEPPNAPQQAFSGPREAWAQVLARHVDHRGRVDFAAVAADPAPLLQWLNFVAQVSPRSHPEGFPSKAHVLAYYLDAYNALAMYGVIASGAVPDELLKFFLLRKYPIGGETMTLYRLENAIIRPLGESRIHFALNCMAASCPRLPQRPWDPGDLDAQLTAAAREFFDNPAHLRVDPSTETVYLSAILDFFTADFLAEADSLLAYVNRYRSAPVPLDYEVAFLDYDWSVNRQPGTALPDISSRRRAPHPLVRPAVLTAPTPALPGNLSRRAQGSSTGSTRGVVVRGVR